MTTTNAGSKPVYKTWMSWVGIAAVAVILGLLLPQLMPGQAPAEPAEMKTESKGKLEYTAPPLPEAPSLQGMFVRLGAGTAIVLGLCVATVFGIRRWLYPTTANGSMPRELRLMETLHLGNRCSLHLVHLNKQPVLVGVDGAGIKTIVPLPTAFEDVLTQAETPPSAAEPIPALKLAA